MALSTGSALLDWLDGWGPELRSRVHMAQQKAWTEVAPNMTGESTVHSPMLKPGGLRVGTDCSGISICEALKHCQSLRNSKWKVHNGELPSQVACKRRQIMKLKNWHDVWTFLWSVRCLTQKRSLGNDRFALRSLGRASCHR